MMVSLPLGRRAAAAAAELSFPLRTTVVTTSPIGSAAMKPPAPSMARTNFALIRANAASAGLTTGVWWLSMPLGRPTPQRSRLAARAVVGRYTPVPSLHTPTSGASRNQPLLPQHQLLRCHSLTWNVDRILQTGGMAPERVVPSTNQAASAPRLGRQVLAGFLRGALSPVTHQQTV